MVCGVNTEVFYPVLDYKKKTFDAYKFVPGERAPFSVGDLRWDEVGVEDLWDMVEWVNPRTDNMTGGSLKTSMHDHFFCVPEWYDAGGIVPMQGERGLGARIELGPSPSVDRRGD